MPLSAIDIWVWYSRTSQEIIKLCWPSRIYTKCYRQKSIFYFLGCP